MQHSKFRRLLLIGLSCLGGCILCLGVIIVVGVVWLSRDEQHINRHRKDGDAYYDSKQYLRAATEYSALIESSPEDPECYYLRSLAYNAMGEYDKSIADDSKALSLSNDNNAYTTPLSREYIAEIYYCRALNYEGKKDKAHALEDYSYAVTADPKNAKLYMGRGELYHGTQKYDLAISDFSKAVQIDPKDADIYLWRGSAYDTTRQYAKAISDYSKVVQIDPRNADAYTDRGKAYDTIEKYDNALGDFSKALQIDPKSTDAYLYRGQTYDEVRKFDKALSDFNKAAQMDPKNSAVYEFRGRHYEMTYQLQKALRDFAKAVQINPSDTYAWEHTGWTQYCNRDMVGAIRSSEKALHIDPNLIDVRLNLGLFYAVQNNWASARTEYERALHNANPTEIQSGLADVQYALNQHPNSSALKQAQTLLRSALHHASKSH